MTRLHQLTLEELESRLTAHKAGTCPHPPFVLISHVPWPDVEPAEPLYLALCEHHRNNAPWERASRHLLVDAHGGFWINPDMAWLPAPGRHERGQEPVPAMIDMLVDSEPSPPPLRNQLKSVAAALLAISNAFEFDAVPSVRWQSIRLRTAHAPVWDRRAARAACSGG